MRREKSLKISARHRAVVGDYIGGGKSLERAIADNGFSAAYGTQGMQSVTRASRLFREAFNQELESAFGNLFPVVPDSGNGNKNTAVN